MCWNRSALEDQARADAARAGCRSYGGHLWASHRARRRLPDDARPRCAQPDDGCGLRASGRDADGDDHRAKAIRSSREARFQIVDIVATMRPLTKMATQIVAAQSIPTLVRGAFRVAQQERPGPVLLELPEDIAADDAAAEIVPPHAAELPVAPQAAIERAAAMIIGAKRPLVMLGAAASRPQLAEPLSAFVRRAKIPFFNTQMGKGAVNAGSNLYMGTAALSERDWVHEAIDRADLIISIGHDTVEKPPFLMGHDGPQVIHVGATPATVEQVYFPQAEIVGDVGAGLAALADRLEGKLQNAGALLGLREGILARLAEGSTERKDFR